MRDVSLDCLISSVNGDFASEKFYASRGGARNRRCELRFCRMTCGSQTVVSDEQNLNGASICSVVAEAVVENCDRILISCIWVSSCRCSEDLSAAFLYGCECTTVTPLITCACRKNEIPE